MTTPFAGTPPRPAPSPIAGVRFKAAAALAIEGTKRRKLLCLIAAYQDAGHAPSVRELAERIDGVRSVRQLDGLLRALERDEWLRVEWSSKGSRRRNVYTVRLDGQHATTYPPQPRSKRQ
jgi:hypothetical protein